MKVERISAYRNGIKVDFRQVNTKKKKEKKKKKNIANYSYSFIV